MTHAMFRNVRSAHENARSARRLADEFSDVSGYEKWRADRMRDYRKAKERYRWYLQLIRQDRLWENRYE